MRTGNPSQNTYGMWLARQRKVTQKAVVHLMCLSYGSDLTTGLPVVK
jgi:hypothetical protein